MSLIIQKIKLPPQFWPRLEELLSKATTCVRCMLKNRSKDSTKDYPELPSVLAKALIRKYQRNAQCQNASKLVLAVCGDKGKQVKLNPEGFRVPAFFKREIIRVSAWLHPIEGFIHNVEFLCRKGQWYAHVCYATKVQTPITPEGCIGIDRNSVGNVAVLADSHNGKVRHLGFDPFRTKYVWRHRKKNLQRFCKGRLLHPSETNKAEEQNTRIIRSQNRLCPMPRSIAAQLP
jgi:transposase